MMSCGRNQRTRGKIEAAPIGVTENFENYLDQNPALQKPTIEASDPPGVQTSQDLDGDSAKLLGNGYLLVACSKLRSGIEGTLSGSSTLLRSALIFGLRGYPFRSSSCAVSAIS